MKGTNNKKIRYLLTLFAYAAMLLTQCTPEKKYQVLSFFFDDVPNPNETTTAQTLTADSTGLIVSTSTRPESYLHKPFAEENCKSCHEGSFSNRLLKPLPELCYTCHQDFGTKYQNLHGPVASGNCIACHDQHEAKYEKLLKREGQDLCLYCHVSQQVFRNKVHQKVGTANCTDCHNPHGADGRGMLNPGTCFKCHDNFKTKYNFIHGPVASNNCGSCHGSHGSGIPKLLLRESQDLCLSCHLTKDVFANKVHKKIKTKNCTDCHNPHGGEDRFILVESLRPIKTKPSSATNFDINNDSLSRVKESEKAREDSTQNIPAATGIKPAENNTTKVDSSKVLGGAKKIDLKTNVKTSKSAGNKAAATKNKAKSNSDSSANHPFVIKKAGNDSLPIHNFLFLLKQFMDSNTINPIPYAPVIPAEPKKK